MRRAQLILATALLLSPQAWSQVIPAIASVSPPSAPVGSQALTLSVTGANFLNGAAVILGGVSLATSYVGPSQLTATIPANMLAAPGQLALTVVNPGGGSAPGPAFAVVGVITIAATVPPAATAGETYSFPLTVTGGRPPYLWSATTGLPPGLTLGADGIIGGVPQTPGQYSIGLRVIDAQNTTASATVSLSVLAPTFAISNPSALPSGRAEQEYSYRLAVTGTAAATDWSVSQGALPAGLTLDRATGLISGIPTTAGSFSFTIQARNAANLTANKLFTLQIDAAALTITTRAPLFAGTVGQPYSLAFRAIGGTQPYQWSMDGDVPGLSLERTSGTLQGTPRTAGSYPLRITVTDSARASVAQSFTLTIDPPALTITTAAALAAGAVGADYSAGFAASGGTAPYSWSLTSGAVPGLSFDASGPQLAGIPSAAGNFTLQVQVRDAAGTAVSKSFTLTINALPMRFTTATALPKALFNEAYEHVVEVAGGTPPYTWLATGLPAGLEMDAATGRIGGTPAAAGSFRFTVRVTDGARVTVAELFTLEVALPAVPDVVLTGLPPVARPGDQVSLQASIREPYPMPITGQATLTFSPDSGGGDSTIQFAGGGRTTDFAIPQGATAVTAVTPLALQTGTVAGTITVSVRLRVAGVDIGGTTSAMRVERAAPVIQSVTVTRSGSGLSIQIVGFSTPREVTQAVFRFTAGSGQTLQTPSVTVPVEEIFGQWFRQPGSVSFGSIFSFTQTFNVQGDSNAVSLQSVELANRVGSTTSTSIRQ